MSDTFLKYKKVTAFLSSHLRISFRFKNRENGVYIFKYLFQAMICSDFFKGEEGPIGPFGELGPRVCIV